MAISYLSARHCHVTVKIATELIVSLYIAVIRREAVYRQRHCIRQGGLISPMVAIFTLNLTNPCLRVTMWTFATGRVFTRKTFLSLNLHIVKLHTNLFCMIWKIPAVYDIALSNTALGSYPTVSTHINKTQALKRSYRPLLDTKTETEPDRHILFTNMPGKVVLESQNLVTICFYHTVNQYTLLFLARIH